MSILYYFKYDMNLHIKGITQFNLLCFLLHHIEYNVIYLSIFDQLKLCEQINYFFYLTSIIIFIESSIILHIPKLFPISL